MEVDAETMFWWVSMTPLGLPVVPDVYTREARSISIARCAAIIENVRELVFLDGGIDYGKNRVCFQDPEYGDYRLGGVIEKHDNPVPVCNAITDKSVGDTVGLVVDIQVTQTP
jgi:hypothetical protein